jgi:sulfonate transport system substrate-binding protein
MLAACSAPAASDSPAAQDSSAPASAAAEVPTEETTAPAENATLRVAYLSTANYFTLVVQDNKLLPESLAKIGSKAEYVGPSIPVEALNAVTSGNADVSSTGTGYFLYLVEQGGPWTAFALEKYTGNSQGIVAAPDSGIEKLEDLYGKKIGSGQKGATGDYIIYQAFKNAGLDVSKVEIVTLNQQDYVPAFTSGQIDALATFDQNLANALSIPGAKLITDGTQYGSLNWTIHIADSTFAKEHPDVLKAAYEALKAESEAAKANPSIITDAYKNFGASEESLAEIAKFAVPEILPYDATAVADLKAQAEQYVSYGWFTEVPDIDAHVLDVTTVN